MAVLNAKPKFIISISVIFALIGVTYLSVGIFKKYLPESGVRNSTDEIGNRVLLSRADFLGNTLDVDWTSPHLMLTITDESVRFDSEGQSLISPRLNSNFTKYIEISVSDISGSDGAFLVSGYNRAGLLLEEKIVENINLAQTYSYRFSYDHVFIDYVVFTYLGQEAVLAVDNVTIYALQ